MSIVNIIINNISVSVDGESTVLDAARKAGIYIPSLCHVKGLHEGAVCRVCVVENSKGELITACNTSVSEGMEIYTDTEKVCSSRRMTLELMCENHRMDCDNCDRYTDCEFHNICAQNGINSDNYELFSIAPKKDASAAIVRDTSKCILCRRCVGACSRQGLSLISALSRGRGTQIGTALPLSESMCIGCGQCVAVCPTAALTPSYETEGVWNFILKKKKPLAAIVTSAAAGMLGEAYYDEVGHSFPNKVSAILRKIGFDKVYSAEYFSRNHDALLASEVAEKGVAISACPGVKSYIDKFAPHLKTKLSSSQTALSMLVDAVAEELGDCDIVFIGTCTALKNYTEKLGLKSALTVPEIGAMIDRASVSRASALGAWKSCDAEDYDCPKVPAIMEDNSVCYTEINNLAEFIQMTSDHNTLCGIIKAYACPGTCINGGGQHRLTSSELSDKVYLLR